MKYTTLFLCILFSFSTAYGNIFGNWRPKSDFRGSNTSGQTEAGLPCPGGVCDTNTSRVRGPQSIPVGTGALATGMRRALTNLYGFCRAKDPLELKGTSNEITIGHETHRSYQLHSTQAEANAHREFFIPGLEVTSKFDHVRGVNPNVPASGAYASVERGSRQCSNTVQVGGERIRPSQVHKMFGNGASGRLINNEFGTFSCGSQAYLNTLSEVNKAHFCGLRKDSPPGITIDCAELIGLSAIASCKKLHPNQTFGRRGEDSKNNGKIYINGSQLGTHNLSGNGNPCLNTPPVSAAAPVASGDIFVMGGHSIVITEVGSDPFGIVAAGNNCGSIHASKFNFSFGQSASYGALGPVQTTAEAYSEFTSFSYRSDPSPLSHLVAMAKAMCLAKNAGRPSGVSTDFIQSRGVRQLRHNKDDSRCSYAEGTCPKSAGSECSDYCGV